MYLVRYVLHHSYVRIVNVGETGTFLSGTEKIESNENSPTQRFDGSFSHKKSIHRTKLVKKDKT